MSEGNPVTQLAKTYVIQKIENKLIDVAINKGIPAAQQVAKQIVSPMSRLLPTVTWQKNIVSRSNRQNFMRKQTQGKRQGKGARGIRYFKLKSVTFISATSGTLSSSSNIYDPSAAQEWSSIVALFDTYRVHAIKMQWCPYSPNEVQSVMVYAPCYVLADFDATTAPVSTAANAIQYENLKVKNLFKPWTYYIKIPKLSSTSISGVNIYANGYIDTSTTPTNLGQLLLFSSGNTGALNYGSYILTYYISCRDRR